MSFVHLLMIEDRTVHEPTWRDVEEAIASLDANEVTLVILSPAPPKGPPGGDHHMAIGGSTDDRCIVYMTEDNLNFWNLENRTKQGGNRRILMRVGGQEGDYREEQCVPREWALAAARAYFVDGRRSDDLPWYHG